jgi:hypothetical protein
LDELITEWDYEQRLRTGWRSVAPYWRWMSPADSATPEETLRDEGGKEDRMPSVRITPDAGGFAAPRSDQNTHHTSASAVGLHGRTIQQNGGGTPMKRETDIH